MTDVVLVHGTTQNAAGFAPLVAELRADGHRALTVDVPSGALGTVAEHAELLAAQLPDDLDHPETLAAAMPSMVCTDISSLWSEVPVEDPARLPSTYLLPTRDRTLRVAWMRRAARERLGVEPVLIEAGHNCYVTHPRATADAVLG